MRLSHGACLMDSGTMLWISALMQRFAHAGFEDRKQLYMLYHYLNHTSLFGGGYKGSAESILRNLSSKYG